MRNHQDIPVSIFCVCAGIACLPSIACAGLYTVGYIGNSLYAITSMNGNATDKERYQRFLVDFDHTAVMNDTFSANSFSGTGFATATASVQLVMTSTTVSWSGSVASAATLGDAISAHPQAESALDMLFTVSQPTLFTYSGNASLVINPVSQPPLSAIASLLWNQGTSGTLQPGQYRVMGHVRVSYEITGNSVATSVNSTGQFNIEMTFAPVPSPGTASVAIAIGALPVARRRRAAR